MRQRRATIKNPQQEVRIFRLRSIVAASLVLVLACCLLARLFFLQVVEHDIYTTRSDKNRVRVEPLPPTRGLIYDRNGRLLAENRPNYNLTIVRERAVDLETTLERLVEILDLPPDEIEDFKERSRQRQRPYQPALLMSELSQEQIARLAVNRYRLPGVEVEAQLLRYYPDAKPLSHTLGYVGRINQAELKTLDKGNYSGTHFIGKTGIERFYEEQLHGQAGLRKVETNARGRVLRELSRTDPVPGKDLTLTVDRGLQDLAYRLLKGRRGAIVAIEPKTGEILAMASVPGFNSNEFVTGISVKSYRALRTDLDLPLFNRAIRGQYPPASTVKPFMSLAGLENGAITTSTTFFDPGYFQLPNDSHKYRNWLRWGHGRVNMRRGIAVSNDTYFYNVAYRLGIDRISEYMHKFGFGEQTALDVQGALPGLMPSKEWKRNRYNKPWYPGETISIGSGQGYWLATPLQLAAAEATLANRGKQVQPHLAKRIGDDAVLLPESDQKPPIVLENPAWWDDVISALEDVVSGREGTARKYVGPGLKYRMAGKSGTAQVFTLGQDQKYNGKELAERLRDHALFAAFAPVEDPEIAVSVVIENGQGGSSVAGPMARAVTDYWLLPRIEPAARDTALALVEALKPPPEPLNSEGEQGESNAD
ncbi:MAG: penicillin-binding protein 2 [Cobetia crustatorum]